MGFHNFSILYHEVEPVDDAAVVGQGQRGVHHAVDPGFQRRGEQLLGGNVGDIILTGEGYVVARLPDMALRQLHGQVCSKGVGVVKGLEVQGVHLFQPFPQGVQVNPPLFHALPVAADADGGEDGVPEPLYGLVLRRVRKYPLRPAGDGDGGDAPGEAAAHLKPVKLL